jgi:hypothetical protein
MIFFRGRSSDPCIFSNPKPPLAQKGIVMLKLTRTTATASLIMLAAMLTLPQAARAACEADFISERIRTACIGSGSPANDTARASTRGVNALSASTASNFNTATGYQALYNNTTGNYNTATGSQALYINTIGSYNTASGAGALMSNRSGQYNTASGVSALLDNTTGEYNTAVGYGALFKNISSIDNSSLGFYAGGKQTGSRNTSIGSQSAFPGSFDDDIRLTGSDNIAVGYRAGSRWGGNNLNISNNIAIGHLGVATDANTIRIGTSQTATFIAGIANARVTKGSAVFVNAQGQLGTSRSSIRYKEDVHSMGDASNPLMKLRPVTFRYKEAEPDGSKPIQYGLIADEVEKVMPDLVIYNDQGTPESVAYDILPSLLLNEYQKQGRKLAAAEARLEAMEAEMAALKLAVSRLAAAPSTVKLAATAP